MNFPRDSALALQRHYLGALSKPAPTWLEPLPANRLAFAGSAIRVDRDGCVLDFGAVDSMLGERRTVRVFRPGDQAAAIRVAEAPAWLAMEWMQGEAGALLAVRITEDAEGERSCVLALWVRDELGARRESLRVRIEARPRHPIAAIAFNGSTTPQPFDFGVDDRAYAISVANRTSVPLVVTFADLPEWMELTVDGCSRRGPLAGVFFERVAPFSVALRPGFLGPQKGSLRMQTNDPRPEMRDMELQFSACVAPVHPHVRVVPPPSLITPAGATVTTHARLENWGRSPARVTCKTGTSAVIATQIAPIPPARDGQPGTAVLPIRIVSSDLLPGAHTLVVDLHVQDGDPAHCSIPLRVSITPAIPRRRREIRPEMIAALVALLLLTAVLFIALRGLS